MYILFGRQFVELTIISHQIIIIILIKIISIVIYQLSQGLKHQTRISSIITSLHSLLCTNRNLKHAYFFKV